MLHNIQSLMIRYLWSHIILAKQYTSCRIVPLKHVTQELYTYTCYLINNIKRKCQCLNKIVYPVFSYVTENLAFGKSVTVSKRYNYKHFDPSLAVDGDVSTDLLKCSLTASGEKEAWLTVDLGEVKNIASISFLHGGCKQFLKRISHVRNIIKAGSSEIC